MTTVLLFQVECVSIIASPKCNIPCKECVILVTSHMPIYQHKAEEVYICSRGYKQWEPFLKLCLVSGSSLCIEFLEAKMYVLSTNMVDHLEARAHISAYF